MKVIIAFNDNYVKPASTLIASVMKNTKSNVSFHVLATDISKENKSKLCAMCAELNCTVEFIDVKKYAKKFDLNKFMCVRDDYKYISVETYYRFFIPDIFKNDSKVLYLDVDMIVEDDISKLFDTDISNHYAAVVQDAYATLHIKNKNISPFEGMTFMDYYKNKLQKKRLSYFNAGVMLLNLDLIRKYNISEKLWCYVANHSPLVFQDQDAMNAVMEDKLKYVDGRWNVFPQFPDKNPAIIHYVGAEKPFSSGINSTYCENYWKYAKLTPFFSKKDMPKLEEFEKPVIKKFCLFGKRILKIKKYKDKLKIKFLNSKFIFGDNKNKFEKYIKKKNIKKRMKFLANKYTDKKIMFYGAGVFAETIFKNNPWHYANPEAIGISDKRFREGINWEFFGIKCVHAMDLRNLDYDVIFTLVPNYNVSDYLEDEILEGSKNEDVEIVRFI